MVQDLKELKEGIKLHLVDTKIFKTDLSVVFITVPLKRESVTKNALIPAILKRGSKNFKSQNEINKKLNEMYGAEYDCGIDKNGDNLVLKFYIESINDFFLPKKEENLISSIYTLIDIVFNPLIENNSFKKEYLDIEKERLKILINSQRDDKDTYSFEKCINLIYSDNGYGLSKYGYIEDLDKIDEKNLYDYYKLLIDTGKIDIFISGNFDKDKITSAIENNDIIKNLIPRKENFIINDVKKEKKQVVEKINEVEEKMDVMQGKLVIGLDVMENELEDLRYITLLYNTILGDGANSKLFRNVREKESMAYTTKSNYVPQKNNLFIRCGIEVNNYQKAVELIKEQIEDMKKGNFSDEDIENAKRYIYSGIRDIDAEQDTGIIFLLGHELSKIDITTEEYMQKIKNITKEDIIKIANSIQINTIYFLRNN